MTIDLDELERLHREATPGEWRHGSVEKGAVFVFYAEALGGYERVLFRANGAFDYSADLALACAAVNALPELLQAARRAATMTSADGVISSLKATLESLRRERDAAARNLAAVTAERDALRDLFESAKLTTGEFNEP